MAPPAPPGRAAGEVVSCASLAGDFPHVFFQCDLKMSDEFYGKVNFYNNERSFGFITRDDNVGLGDVFVGRNGAGLHAGAQVSFEIEIGYDGRHRAIKVKVVRDGAV
jgi:cold shock CspA family protein